MPERPHPQTSEEALADARRAAAERPYDVGAVSGLARALAARVPEAIGPDDPAPDDALMAALAEAVAGVRRWCARAPGDPEAAGRLADLLAVHSQGAGRRGDADLAKALIDESIELRRLLVFAARNDTTASGVLADAYVEAADQARDRGDLAATRGYLAGAIEVLRRFAPDPADPDATLALASALDDLGDTERDAGNAVGAVDAYREAADLYATITTTDEVARAQLPGCLRDLGDVLRELGQHTAALAACKRAAMAAQVWLGAVPGDADARSALVAALETGACAADAAGRPDRAALLRAEAASIAREAGGAPAAP